MQATLINTEKNPRLKISVIRVPSFYRTLISRMQATLINTEKKSALENQRNPRPIILQNADLADASNADQYG
jgi:hypothetical protein